MARLISSASTTLANSGPGRNSNSPRLWSKTIEPVTSAGSRSAVHCTREKLRPSVAETVRTSNVLATPGDVVEQHVPVGQQGDDDEARLVGLADDDAPHLIGDGATELDGRGNGRRDDGVVVYGEPPAVACRDSTSPRRSRCSCDAMAAACGRRRRRPRPPPASAAGSARCGEVYFTEPASRPCAK